MHYNVNNLNSRDRNCVSHHRINATIMTPHIDDQNMMHDKKFDVLIFV